MRVAWFKLTVDSILIRTLLMSSSKTCVPQPTALSRSFYSIDLKHPLAVGGGGGCPVTFLLPLKISIFSQFIINCWFELVMSSLDATRI